MIGSRFDRNIRFFGQDGQNRIRAASVAVVGVGGLGTHVVQQLSYLGVGSLTVIDGDKSEASNMNRNIGMFAADVREGTLKVDVAERHAKSINPTIEVNKVTGSVVSEAGFRALRNVTYVFGCVDNDGARVVLNEFCAAYELPYFDLASDVLDEGGVRYGGRVCINVDGNGCLVCMDLVNVNAAGRDLATADAHEDHHEIYGVPTYLLDERGPSVAPLNGVIASLAVMEFTVCVSGLRSPHKLLTYYGGLGKVTNRIGADSSGCWYCSNLRGEGEGAKLERYIQSDAGN